MKYHIKEKNGDILASFVNECDRDYSLDALLEMFPDAELIAYDEEERAK